MTIQRVSHFSVELVGGRGGDPPFREAWMFHVHEEQKARQMFQAFVNREMLVNDRLYTTTETLPTVNLIAWHGHPSRREEEDYQAVGLILDQWPGERDDE